MGQNALTLLGLTHSIRNYGAGRVGRALLVGCWPAGLAEFSWLLGLCPVPVLRTLDQSGATASGQSLAW